MKTQQLFNEWINQLSGFDLPDEDIIAFNFGIFENGNGFTIYLSGSTEFDEDDYDWTCNDDYVPFNNYFNLDGQEYVGLDWQIALNKVEELVSKYIQADDFKKSILANAIAITVGFDEGDLIRVK